MATRISEAQRNQTYGKPSYSQSIDVTDLLKHKPIRSDTGVPQRVRAHRLVANHFAATWNKAVKQSDWLPMRCDSHVIRNIRGSSQTSLHSWAVAWDIFIDPWPNPPVGGVWTPTDQWVWTKRYSKAGYGEGRCKTEQFCEFVSTFERAGFTWGGRFRRRDTPHFEWSGMPPTDAQNLTPEGEFRLNLPYYRLGSIGQQVENIQDLGQWLHSQHPSVYPHPGPTDGVYGRSTERFVKAWQTALNIKSDGIWGPITAAESQKLFAFLEHLG